MHVGGSQQQQGKHVGCASSSEIISFVLYRESNMVNPFENPLRAEIT